MSIALQPASITAVASGTADAQGVAAANGLRLMGFSCRESDGTPAVASFVLRHGTLDTDTPIAFVELAANASLNILYPDGGIKCPNGIFVDRVSGTTELVIYTKS